MLARALTKTIKKADVSVIVEQYTCKSHHQTWTIRAVGIGQAPELENEQEPASPAVSPAESPTVIHGVSPAEPPAESPDDCPSFLVVPSERYSAELQAESPIEPLVESSAEYPVSAESPTPAEYTTVPEATSPSEPAAELPSEPPAGGEFTSASPVVSSLASSAVRVEAFIDKGVAGVKGAVLGAQVCIRADGKQVYPQRGDKGKLWEDFKREWNFRGMVAGIGMLSPTEKWIPGTLPTDVANESGVAHAVQDAILGQSTLKSMYEVEVNGQKYPAVIQQQLPDGCFDVVAFQPDENGFIQQVHYPSLDKSCIVISGSEKHLEVPECLVAFSMPKSNPRAMTLTAGGFPFKDLLGRISPKLGQESNRIRMDVPKAAKQLVKSIAPMVGVGSLKEDPISINVGAAVLRHFLSGEVQICDSGATRLSKWWTLQLGPFAEHTVKIEKKNRLSPSLTLTVDGEVLVECCGQAMGSSPGTWQCKFRFVGERHIDFNVFETTRDGVQLDSKGIVTKCFSYEHVVELEYQHRTIDDLSSIQLTVDGVPANQLPVKVAEHEEPDLCISRDILELQYGVQVPEKVVRQDTRSTARKLAGRVLRDWEQKHGSVGEVLVQKAGETSAFFSQVAVGVQDLFQASRSVPKTEHSAPISMSKTGSMPSLLTSRPTDPTKTLFV